MVRDLAELLLEPVGDLFRAGFALLQLDRNAQPRGVPECCEAVGEFVKVGQGQKSTRRRCVIARRFRGTLWGPGQRGAAMPRPTNPRRRVDAYIRVSRVGKRRGPTFLSPAIQRDAIEAWAAAKGLEILEVFEELDASGSRGDRPLLQRAISRIEIGVSDALVVWRVDRFGRSWADGVKHVERIRSVGGGFYSVGDGLDIDSAAGRLALGVLLSAAEYQLDNIRAGWEEATERAVRRGVHPEWLVPVGYRKTRTGRLRVHPVDSPVVAEVYERRARGLSLVKCAQILEEHGVLTGKGNPGWNPTSLANMLRSRVYLGEVRWGPFVNEKAHSPLTDASTWEAAQNPNNVRFPPPRNVHALLAGLVRCAGCAHKMSPVTIKEGSRESLIYRCNRFHAAGRCPRPARIRASKLEPYVVDAMFSVLHRRRRRPAAELAAAELAARDAAATFRRYRDNDAVATRVGERAYLDGLSVRERKLSIANLALYDVRQRSRLAQLPASSELREQMAGFDVAQRRDVVAQVIDVVFVLAGQGSAAQRTIVCPAGTSPRQLPHQGDHGRSMRKIEPRRGWINPT